MIFFLKFVGSSLLSRGLTFDFSFSSLHFFALKKVSSIIERQKIKGHEKRERPLVSKVELNFQIS